MTNQDGLASMVSSVGYVGPCDVFVKVSAGRSTVQFQMESLPAIIPVPPRNIHGKPPVRPGRPFSGVRPSAMKTAPTILFSVPPMIAPGDPDTNQQPCSGDTKNDVAKEAADDTASKPCAGLR